MQQITPELRRWIVEQASAGVRPDVVILADVLEHLRDPLAVLRAARAALAPGGRLVLGLLRRCRRAVYLGLSELNEQGYEQRGPLLEAFQRILRRSAPEDRGDADG